MIDKTAKNIIFTHAMSRSGQHAVIDWIFNQFENNRVFFNYMKLYPDIDPYSIRSQYYFNEEKYFHKLNENWKKHGVLDEKLKEFKLETSVLWKSICENEKNLISMNFENIDFTSHEQDLKYFTKKFIAEERFSNVLVVRDIFNYIASKMKMGRYFHPETNLGCWKAHAYEYLGYTNSLRNKVLVNFNSWVKDEAYRKDIAESLCVDNFLPKWNEVSSFGGGSSFDGKDFHGNASSMNVLNRWREYVDDKEFRSYLKNYKELVELSEAIFGHIPGTEIFKK